MAGRTLLHLSAGAVAMAVAALAVLAVAAAWLALEYECWEIGN